MDRDGVTAQLCFPSFPGFAGTRFLTNKDRALSLECVKAYNDFILDEWCAYAPDRQIPMGILPLWEPALCRAEIERIAALGMRAISFPENPVPLGLPPMADQSWHPIWAAAESAQLPVCLHIGTSGQLLTPNDTSSFVVSVALMPLNNWMALIDLLFSPVFHTFPGLRICLSEGGIGWLPAALERADYIWDHHRWHDSDVRTDIPPSALYRQNVYGCMLHDEVGIMSRHMIGVDRILFESDYPHSDGKWPHSREYAEQLLRDVPDDEAHRMIELNARELFRFPKVPPSPEGR
jgi:predicted TIM-barrel fold metal-dependent hydrolase